MSRFVFLYHSQFYLLKNDRKPPACSFKGKEEKQMKRFDGDAVVFKLLVHERKLAPREGLAVV